MQTDSIAGGVARLDTTGGGEPAHRLHYRVVDLYGREIAEIFRDDPLEEDDVIELYGQRWKVCSTAGATARVTRL